MCAERVIVALGSIELGGQRMARGDVKVFKTGERYSPPTGGDYVEVAYLETRASPGNGHAHQRQDQVVGLLATASFRKADYMAN